MKAIKGASAHGINRSLCHHGAVWQEESFDRVLRSSENLDAKIDYVLHNPVRAGLVRDLEDYRWLWRKPLESPYAPPEKLIGMNQFKTAATCVEADALGRPHKIT